MAGHPYRIVAPFALALAIAVPAHATAAPPPDVTGQPIAAAGDRLREWRAGLTFTFVPPLEKLPTGADRELAAVAKVVILNDIGGQPDPEGTVAELTVAAKVPPLLGLDRGAATALLRRHGLVPAVTPLETSRLWTVRTQAPAEGTLLPHGSRVSIVVGPPVSPAPTTPPAPTPTPEEPVLAADPPVPFPTATVLTAAGVGLLLLLLLAVGGLLLRRAPRRLAVADVAIHPYPGRIVGPAVTDAGGGPALSVRLEPHPGPGTHRVEEVEPWG